MDVIAKARELGELIAASTEMTAFNAAEEKLAADSRGQELMNEYKNLQIKVVKAVKEDKNSAEAEEARKELLAKQEEINEYEITGNYLRAKADVDKLMKTVNDVIIFSITGEEPCSPSKCGSCGGGCK